MGGRRSVEEIREWTDDIRPLIAEARAAGAATLQEIADALNARGIPAFSGGS